MLPDPNDTIVALASAPGPSGRGIVRLSGKQAFDILAGLSASPLAQRLRSLVASELVLPGLYSRLPCDAYLFPGPRSYTGDDVAELHLVGSPPLLELLVATCLNLGARAAQPGEFTLRAFRAGKLDLTRAEAVLGVIEAGDRDELKQALLQLAGGMAQPLQRLREELLDLLADVEAALDFVDDEVQSIPTDQLLLRITSALAHVTLIQRQIEQRARAERPFRVVLAGAPNAGKSSLFNAILGKSAAIVSARPGTTRDYLEGRLEVDGVPIQVVDTAGLRDSTDPIESAAQALGRQQQESAETVLWCQEAWTPGDDTPAPPPEGALLVWTKCDLAAPPETGFATSAATGQGLDALKAELARRAKQRPRPPLAPSLSRCRHHVESCLACLRRAHAVALHEDPMEILALEIRSALDELGAMVGAVFTEDLLDRIFSRFCIGK